MIRPVSSADTPSVVELAVACGLFPPDDAGIVEKLGDLRASGQRLLLVQTSGLPAFERARAFYLSCGYDQEARVRDYYEPGDDMILFRKALAA